MINLLPQKEKQELIFQKNKKLVIVLGSIIIVFLVCLTLILLSLKFYVLQKVSYEKSILAEIENTYQTAEFLSLLDSVKKYNANFIKINSFYKKEIHLSDILKSIILIERPEGITFNSMAIERAKADDIVKANLYGLSASREELLSFKSSIESHENVKNVYLPPENLVIPTNINFHLTFEIININK